MKCPKCNYIAFDSTVRCRNCGFDFSLARSVEFGSDLPLRPPEPAAPMGDFDLGSAKRQARSPESPAAAERVHDPAFDPGVPPAPASELPLFGEVFFGEAPVVRPSTPIAPLSVRRSTPAPPRARASVTPRPPDPRPDPGLPLGSPSFTTLGLAGGTSAPAPAGAAAEAVAGAEDVAGFGVRLGAAALDWLMLAGLDLAVVYFTLRVSRLQTGEILLLPAAPLAAFLLLLNAGYLAMVTAAGGQTLGKMAFHLRVVSAGEAPLTVGRSLVRVVSFLVSALPAGLGLLPAVFDRSHRGLHDRLSGTRVVHAGTP
jgi:uncharacterized RDD family membrane protein YckC